MERIGKRFPLHGHIPQFGFLKLRLRALKSFVGTKFSTFLQLFATTLCFVSEMVKGDTGHMADIEKISRDIDRMPSFVLYAVMGMLASILVTVALWVVLG